MKKLLLILIIITSCFLTNAQDFKKFKENYPQYQFNPNRLDDFWHYNNNFWPVSNKENPKLYGAIDNQGEIIIPIQYQYIGKLSEGTVLAQFKNKYGFLDRNGKKIINFKYDDAGHFIGGTADAAKKIKKSGSESELKWFRINKFGKKVIKENKRISY